MDKRTMRDAVLCPEYKPARQRIDELEAENAALREQLEKAKQVPMKYRRMEFNAQLQRENQELREQLAAAQKDAKRYRVVFDDNLGTMRVPLFNAKTGEELQDEARWTIWWNGPNKPLIRDAIDAAIEKENEQ